ncbi:hypothetical protein [Planctomicrobium piriforme]|uniref:Secreted protein n=1 Tax=Planctomicrobium piriforme TaxID=1576369 RepID=A0A1I3JB41_9PLAN|nr:hypothetical protein [Planctomicrobium piriforme]SFI57145.1 hypothetical protein SAMN05421753_110110 [Planctomicrobium piriforme]
MKSGHWVVMALGVLSAPVCAQDQSYIPQATQDVGYESAYQGAASVGSSEPLFRYDDQERWKHGYIQNMPYYEGYHAFRPYNYHHVFSQAQTAAGWGMPATMPYSQQFWHRYENMVDLSRGDHTPVAPYVPPPKEWDHYPKPLRQGTSITPQPGAELQPADVPALPPIPEQVTPPQNIRPAQASWSGLQRPQVQTLVAPY